MELRHLRYFVAVAEELNFTRAAELLSVSQPPLSRQIRDLENELEVKLFDRNRQEVTLTSAGAALLIRAREMLSQAEHLRSYVSEAKEPYYEELYLGYAPSPTAAIIAGILGRYHEKAPGATIKLQDLSLSQILAGVKARKLHAGLTLRPRPTEMAGLVFAPLQQYSVGIICARSSPFAHLLAIPPSQVPPDRLIGYRAPEFPEYRRWVASVLGVQKKRIVFGEECDGVFSLIATVEASQSPAVVGQFTALVAGDRVQYIPFASKVTTMDVGLLYRKGEIARNVRMLADSAAALKPPIGEKF